MYSDFCNLISPVQRVGSACSSGTWNWSAVVWIFGNTSCPYITVFREEVVSRYDTKYLPYYLDLTWYARSFNVVPHLPKVFHFPNWVCKIKASAWFNAILDFNDSSAIILTSSPVLTTSSTSLRSPTSRGTRTDEIVLSDACTYHAAWDLFPREQE